MAYYNDDLMTKDVCKLLIFDIEVICGSQRIFGSQSVL